MKKALKWILIGSGVLFAGFIGLIILLVAITPSSSSNGPKLVETSADGETITAEEGPQVFKVGDSVEIDGTIVTITDAYFTEPNKHIPAENGKVLTLEIQVENISDSEELIDNVSFDLYDMEGNALSRYFAYDESPIYGKIHPGKKLTGKSYFDVPDVSEFELIYTPFMSWSNETATFIIEVQ